LQAIQARRCPSLSGTDAASRCGCERDGKWWCPMCRLRELRAAEEAPVGMTEARKECILTKSRYDERRENGAAPSPPTAAPTPGRNPLPRNRKEDMKRICLIVASLCALAWAGTAAADTYTPMQIQSAGINTSQQLYASWIAPVSTDLRWGDMKWQNCTDVPVGVACSDYATYADLDMWAPGGPYTWTIATPLAPPADANGYLSLAVQVSAAVDMKCTWVQDGLTWYGCSNYSPWTRVSLKASCTQNLVSAGHYVIVRRGHYLKRHGHYVRRNGRRVWIKPVRRWVAPVYGAPTCVWVNA
jgi:hypothetical protein